MSFDIDLDFRDRQEILEHIDYTPATLKTGKKHNSGIYVNKIPVNPFTGLASINYEEAEKLGYIKIDVLNQSVYKLVKNDEHMDALLAKEVPWEVLTNKEFVGKLVHIGNHFELIQQLAEPITSIEQLAMFLALIRPGQRYLLGRKWNYVENYIWVKTDSEVYSFKKSHAIAYALLVVLHIQLLLEDVL